MYMYTDRYILFYSIPRLNVLSNINVHVHRQLYSILFYSIYIPKMYWKTEMYKAAHSIML